MISIRAHQLLCLQGFQGKGYSTDFVNNLQSILDRLISFPETPLQLTNTPSAVCSCCPNLNNTLCAKDPNAEQRMQRRDHATLQKLDVNSSSVKPYQEWLPIIANQFKSRNDVKESCFDCQWQNDCLFYQSLQKNSHDHIQ